MVTVYRFTFFLLIAKAPGGIRTHDSWFTKPDLCAIELPEHVLEDDCKGLVVTSDCSSSCRLSKSATSVACFHRAVVCHTTPHQPRFDGTQEGRTRYLHIWISRYFSRGSCARPSGVSRGIGLQTQLIVAFIFRHFLCSKFDGPCKALPSSLPLVRRGVRDSRRGQYRRRLSPVRIGTRPIALTLGSESYPCFAQPKIEGHTE